MSERIVPFVADRNARREANVASIARGLIAYYSSRSLSEAERSVKDDRAALALIQRTAQTPASPANLTTFNQSVVDATVDILGPQSASAAVFSRAVKATFGRNSSIWVPGVAHDSSYVAFVASGNPMRVLQWDVSKGTTLTAGLKLGFSITTTNELLRHTNAEVFLRQKMIEDIGAGVDALLFDANAAVAGTRPAGLLNGAQTVTASAATVPEDALVADLAGLAAKVGAIGGEIIYVCNVQEQMKIRARLPFFANVFASGAIAAGNLIAIAPRGIAVAGSDQGPRIDTSDAGVMVLDDALTTAQFGTVGTPNVVGAPAVSLFQSDLVAFRLLLPDLCWGQRVAAGTGGCVAALTGAIKW
jgi:hypothetical protein